MASAHRPFLVQNNGWFNQRTLFCRWFYLSGDVHDGVSPRRSRALPSCVYTLLLLWAGTDTPPSSQPWKCRVAALLILGMLLVPLNVAAAVRLLLTAQMSPGLLVLGSWLWAWGWEDCTSRRRWSPGSWTYFATQHPRIFLVLASGTVSRARARQFPFWPLLVVCHGVLLAVRRTGCLVYPGLVARHLLLNAQTGLLAAAPGVCGPGVVVHVTGGIRSPGAAAGITTSAPHCRVRSLFYVTHISAMAPAGGGAVPHLSFGCMGCRS